VIDADRPLAVEADRVRILRILNRSASCD